MAQSNEQGGTLSNEEPYKAVIVAAMISRGHFTVHEAEAYVERFLTADRNALLDRLRELELKDYDDTDPYQQGYMWAIAKAKTVILEAERREA